MAELNKDKLSPRSLEFLKNALPEEWMELQNEKHVNVMLSKFITVDPQMLQMKEHIKTLAEVDDPVLIVGETGTGKELIANALHGDRNDCRDAKGPEIGRFIAVNCAGIPDTLVESALFGHKAGAFTGATKDRVGVFQSAYGGTVFLDEIGELSMGVQAKLLRVLQERCMTKLGGEQDDPIPLNCRFIAATHKNLEELITEDDPKFREDFYYRISTFQLRTKPLFKRWDDIHPIIQSLTSNIEKCNYPIKDTKAFSEIIINALHKDKTTLPGNVRQLQQIIRRHHVLGELPTFTEEQNKNSKTAR